MLQAATSRELLRDSVWIALAALLLFTLGTWNQPFIDFEARFGLFAQEMWRHGPSWFPTTYGEPYPDYPVTSTLLIWLLAHLFGGVIKLAAVLPSALAAALTLVLTYRILAPQSRAWGILAVCFELLCVTFLAEARSISLDMFVTAAATAAFYLTQRLSDDNFGRWLGALALCLIAGFAFRGPLGVVVPSAVVASYLALTLRWRALFIFGGVALLVVVLGWLAQLAMAQHAYGTAFMHEVVRMQVAGRIDEPHAGHRWYYLTSSLGNYALTYPVALLVLVANVRRLRIPARGGSEGMLTLLLGWAAIVLIGLSIPDTKKIRYVLPMVPAIAAIAAYPLVFAGTRFNALVARGLQWLLLLLPGLCMIALAVAKQHAHKRGIPLEVGRLYGVLALLAVAQIAALLARIKLVGQGRSIALAASAIAAFWVVNVLLLEPILLRLHDCTAFVQAVEQQKQQRPGATVFFRIGKDAAAIKYLVNLNTDLQPVFIEHADDIAHLRKPFYLIVQDGDLGALQGLPAGSLQRVVHTHFDHRPVSAFYSGGAAGTTSD